jgi:hypothetical protein
MKKILLMLFLLLSSKIVAAEMAYYHMFSKNTPSLALTEIIVGQIEKKYPVNFMGGIACNSKRKIDQDKNPALIEVPSGRYWYSLHTGDGLCDINLDRVRWLGAQSYTYNLCVKSDSDIKTVSDLNNQKNLKGSYASGSHGGHLYDTIHQYHGIKITGIEYANSNAASLALLSGDVQIAMLLNLVSDRQENLGNIRCIASGDSQSIKSMSRLFPRIPKEITLAKQIFILGVKNATDEQYQDLLKITNVAKKEIDKKIPGNIFEPVTDSRGEKALDSEFKMSVFGLYNVTKTSR